MQIRVLYFAALREQRGCAEEQLVVEDGTTIGALYDSLFPDSTLPVAYALDQRRVPAETRLHEHAEVAFLPPLGGG